MTHDIGQSTPNEMGGCLDADVVSAPAGQHCDRETLRLFLSGGLQPLAVALQVEEHLAVCRECARQAEQIEQTSWEKQLLTTNGSASVGQHRLADAYEVLDEIGRGGAGIVYRALQQPLNRLVALKVLIGGLATQGKALARFRREVLALAKLQHPQIVRILDSGEQDGAPYLAMEYVDGPNLARALDICRPSARQAAVLIADLAGGMSYAHRQGIIHRDLKPHNVLLTPRIKDNRRLPPVEIAGSDTNATGLAAAQFDYDGHEAKLVDFGLSLWEDERFATETGEALGTPAYMAPEMLNSKLGGASELTDVYGLGAILYQCLYGQPPFNGLQKFELIQQVLNSEPGWNSSKSVVPLDLQIICQRCLEKKPTARIASASELESELRRYLAGVPIRARAAGRWERVSKWCRRNPWPTTVAALFVTATIAILGLLLSFQNQLIGQRDQSQQNYDQARAAIWNILQQVNEQTALEIPQLSDMQLAQLRPALGFFESLALNSQSLETQLDLARIRIFLASSLIARREFSEGEILLQQALEQLQGLSESPELGDRVWSEAIAATVKLGVSLGTRNRNQDAIELMEPMVDKSRELCSRDPEDWVIRSQLSWVLHNLACSIQQMGDLDRAADVFRNAIFEREQANELHRKQYGQWPLRWELELGETHVSLATVELTLGRTETAEKNFQAAQRLMQLALDLDPKNLRVLSSAAAVDMNLSNLYAALDRLPDAVAACDRGVERIETVLNADWNYLGARDFGGMLYGNRALYRGEAAEHLPAAVTDWGRACQLFQTPQHLGYARLQYARVLMANSQWIESQQVLQETTIGTDVANLVSFELLLHAKLAAHWEQQTLDSGTASPAEATRWLAERLEWIRNRFEQLRAESFFERHQAEAESIKTGDDYRELRRRLPQDWWVN